MPRSFEPLQPRAERGEEVQGGERREGLDVDPPERVDDDLPLPAEEVELALGRGRRSLVRGEAGPAAGGAVGGAGDHVSGGTSGRPNGAGARQLAAHLATRGLGTTLVDVRGIPGLLHLKSGIAWLGGRTLALARPFVGRPEFAIWDVLEVPVGEEYAANAVLVNGRVLLASGYPRFEADVRTLGFLTVSLDMSEFRKLDGGLSCLSLRF